MQQFTAAYVILSLAVLTFFSWVLSFPVHRIRQRRDPFVEYCGPLEIWLEVLTQRPLLVLLVGLAVPGLLSFLAFQASGYTVTIDLDFAGYLAVEHPMRFLQDAVEEASRSQAAKLGHRRRRAEEWYGWRFPASERSLEAAVLPTSNLDLETAELSASSTEQLPRRLSLKHRRRQATRKWSLGLFYKAVDSAQGVFTQDALNEIRHFEGVIKAFDGYSNFCRKPMDVDECKLADSVTNMFFCVAESSNGTAKLSFDGKGELRDINATLQQMARDDIPWWTDNHFSATNLTSQFTQSTFHGGVPLEGFATASTDQEEQLRMHTDFLIKLYEEVLGPVDTDGSQALNYKHIQISWYEPKIWNHEVRKCLMHDVLWCSGTFVMVFVLIILQLESLFLTLLGLLGVILSFSTSYYFHYVMMGYRTLSVLDLLSLFLILGIAADDMFIMFHTYRLAPTGLASLDEPRERMKYAYKEAGGAMIVTTLTSMGSFYANCVSMVTLIRRFGFFMGTLILWNYINVMVIFSTAILVNDLYIVPCFRRCLNCGRSSKEPSNTLEDVKSDFSASAPNASLKTTQVRRERGDSKVSLAGTEPRIFSDVLSDASLNRCRGPSQMSQISSNARHKREPTVTFQISNGSEDSHNALLPRPCGSQGSRPATVTFQQSDASHTSQESGGRAHTQGSRPATVTFQRSDASHNSQESGWRARPSIASSARGATLSSGFRTTIATTARTVRSVSTRAAGSVLVHRPLQEDKMSLLERFLYRRLHPLIAARHWVLISLCILLSCLGVYFAYAGFTLATGDLVIFPPHINIGRVEEIYKKVFNKVDAESVDAEVLSNFTSRVVLNRTSGSSKEVMPVIEVQACRRNAEGKVCSGHGSCNPLLGSCKCPTDFVGWACSYERKLAIPQVSTAALKFMHILSPPDLLAAADTVTLEQTFELKNLGDQPFRWKASVPANQTWFSVVPKTGLLRAREFDAATDTPQPDSIKCTVITRLDRLPAGWAAESQLEIYIEEADSKHLVKIFAQVALPAGLTDLAVLPLQDHLGHEKVLMVPSFAIGSGWPAPQYDVNIPFGTRSVKIWAPPLASTQEVWVNGVRIIGSSWTSQELALDAGNFKSCAVVNSKCACNGMVRFGSGMIWSPWKESSGALECAANLFAMPERYTASSDRCECKTSEEQWLNVTARAPSSNQATVYKLRIRRHQPRQAPAVSIVRLVAAAGVANLTYAPVIVDGGMQAVGYLAEATAQNGLRPIVFPVRPCLPTACWDWQLLRPLPGANCCIARLENLTTDMAWSFSVRAVTDFGLGLPSIPAMGVGGKTSSESENVVSWAPLSVWALPRAPSILASPIVELHHGSVLLRVSTHQVVRGSSLPLGLLRCISTPGDIRSENESIYVTALQAWEAAVHGLDVDTNYTFRCAIADSHLAAPQESEWLSASLLSAPTQAVQAAVREPSAPEVLSVSWHQDSRVPRVHVRTAARFVDRLECDLRAGKVVMSGAADTVPQNTVFTKAVDKFIQLLQQTDGISASGLQNISCRARVFDLGLPSGGHLWGLSQDVLLPQRPAPPAIVSVNMSMSSLTLEISWVSDGGPSPSSFWCVASGSGFPSVEGSADNLSLPLVMQGLVADAWYHVVCTVRRQGNVGSTAYFLESTPSLASFVDGKESRPNSSAPPAPRIVGVEPSGDRAVLIRLDTRIGLLHHCASVQDPRLAASDVGTAVLVSGLRAGLEYNFTCKVSSSQGTSASSNVSASVVAARPPVAPEILSIIPKSAMLQVVLVPPSSPSARGFATIRKLSCSTDSGVGASADLTHPNQSSLTLQGLSNGVAVRVRCRAESAAGAGHWSEFSDPVMPGVPVAGMYNLNTNSLTLEQLRTRIAAELGLPVSQVSILPQGGTRRLAAQADENASQQLVSGIIEVRVSLASYRDQRIPGVLMQMNNLSSLSSLAEVEKAKVLDETFTDSRLKELAVIEDSDSRSLVAVSPPLPLQTGKSEILKFSAIVSSFRFAVHAVANSHLANIELLDDERPASNRFEFFQVLPATRNVSVKVTAADGSSTLYLIAVGLPAKACDSSCGNGTCNTLMGRCVCDPGWQGEACNSFCPGTPTCGGPARGACLPDPDIGALRCICSETYGGDAGDCSMRVCPRCANNGSCVPGEEEDMPWACLCPATHTGLFCEQALCPGNCSGAGTCDENTGECSCWEGATGPDCSRPEPYKEPVTNCVEVSLVWGIKGYKEATSGETTAPDFDQNFNLFDPAVQEYLLNVSTLVRNDSSLLVREEAPTWIEAWSKFVFSRGGIFPVTDSSLASQGLQAFMHDPVQGKSFEEDIGTHDADFSGRPTFAKLRLTLDLAQDAGPRALQAVRTRWGKVVRMLNEERHLNSAGPTLMVSKSWTKTELEQGIVAQTGEAFLVSVGITLACVVVFTGNIVIALHVLATILLTVCVLFGVVFGLVGYEFGAVEATGCVLFVGLSVDYCLHLAHGYHTASEDTRANKLKQALVNLGPSIIGGGITTVAGTAFLLPCRIVLFVKLGTMLVGNALLSLIYTFFFLAPMLALAGPIDDFGSVRLLVCVPVKAIASLFERFLQWTSLPDVFKRFPKLSSLPKICRKRGFTIRQSQVLESVPRASRNTFQRPSSLGASEGRRHTSLVSFVEEELTSDLSNIGPVAARITCRSLKSSVSSTAGPAAATADHEVLAVARRASSHRPPRITKRLQPRPTLQARTYA